MDRQGVHVGAQADRARARRAAAADDSNNAAAPDPGRHFIATESLKTLGDESGGARNVIEQFGMAMNVAAPALRIGGEILDGGIDRHDGAP